MIEDQLRIWTSLLEQLDEPGIIANGEIDSRNVLTFDPGATG